jgi:hypothetical protein
MGRAKVVAGIPLYVDQPLLHRCAGPIANIAANMNLAAGHFHSHMTASVSIDVDFSARHSRADAKDAGQLALQMHDAIIRRALAHEELAQLQLLFPNKDEKSLNLGEGAPTESLWQDSIEIHREGCRRRVNQSNRHISIYSSALCHQGDLQFAAESIHSACTPPHLQPLLKIL